MRKITRNALYCKLCNETVESENRHDLKFCSGGHFAVYGGLDDLKRSMTSGVTMEDMEDRSEYEIVLSDDAGALMYLSENSSVMSWLLGIELMKLRPDIAERLLAARNEIGEGSSEVYETGLVLMQASDNLLQAVIEIFEKRTPV